MKEILAKIPFLDQFFTQNTQKNTQNIGGDVTIISNSVTINGNITCKGDLRIDGEVIGDIDSTSRIVLGINGNINGNIKCKTAELSGKIKGNIMVEDLLSLRSSACFEGDAMTGKLAIDPGAVFNVTCKMIDKNTV